MLLGHVVLKSIFLVLCILGSNEALHCFNCDPHSYKDECYDPSKHLVPYVNCSNDFLPIKEQHNSTLICLSAFIIFSDTDYIGFYRGCHVQPNSVIDFCDWFEEEYVDPDGFLEWCAPCNTSGCNTGMQTIIKQAENNGDTVYIRFLLVTTLFKIIVF